MMKMMNNKNKNQKQITRVREWRWIKNMKKRNDANEKGQQQDTSEDEYYE